MIVVANAPVSYGVFELTIGGSGLPDPDQLCAAVAGAGYAAIDLGPLGFLGLDGTLRDRLQRHGLALCGGYVPLRLPDPHALEQDLDSLEQTLEVFDSVRDLGPLLPRPTLADAGSPEQERTGLDGEGWSRLAEGVARAAELCRARGYEPTFHHHAGTHVETPAEIERLLDLTDVGLCLDTGHLILGGGDPVEALAKWAARIDHVQLKDARSAVMAEVAQEGSGLRAIWERGAFCELGTGDLDAGRFLAEMSRIGYGGWLVVEQDRILSGPDGFEEAAAAQARNRTFLRRHGL